MARYRFAATLLIAAFGLAPVFGLSGPACVSCCPVPDARGSVISSMACCGDDCVPRLTNADERVCLASPRSASVPWQALRVTVAQPDVRSISANLVLPRPLWLPASARDGTSPLRL